MDWNKVNGAVAFLRENFRNDGAEGESVHVACDAVDALKKLIDELAIEPSDQTVMCRVCGRSSWMDVTEHADDCPIGHLLGMVILPELEEDVEPKD